jgi:hypothetical protein
MAQHLLIIIWDGFAAVSQHLAPGPEVNTTDSIKAISCWDKIFPGTSGIKSRVANHHKASFGSSFLLFFSLILCSAVSTVYK